MKTPFLTMVLALLCSVPNLAAPADSILVRIGPSSKVLFYGSKKADLKKLENYDWNTILRDLNARLSETTATEPRQHYMDLTGKSYLNDSTLRSKNSLVKVTQQQADQPVSKDRIHENLHFLKTAFTVRLGFSPFINSQGGSRGFELVDMFSTKPFSSTNVALGLSVYSAFHTEKRWSVGLRWGLEVDYRRYLWKDLTINEKKYANTPEELQAYVQETTQNFPSSAELYAIEPYSSQYKLVSRFDRITTNMYSLSLPIVPTVRFYNASGKRTFSLGVGGYVGYRFSMKDRFINRKANRDEQMNSDLNSPFQYGLVTSFGYRKIGFYCHYQLGSPLKQVFARTSANTSTGLPTLKAPTGPIAFGITYNGF